MKKQVGMRRFVLRFALAIALLGPIASVRTAMTAIDPHLLSLDRMAYPAGAFINHVHVDATAAAVNADNIFGDHTTTQGSLYQQLHFSGSLFETARLPDFDGALRGLLLMATVFPSSNAAHRAFEGDSSISSCGTAPAIPMPMRSWTCTYMNLNGPESGIYIVAAAGTVEFIVVGFVHEASPAARDQAVDDASLLALHEATHVIHLLGQVPARLGATAAPQVHATVTPAPTATARPTTSDKQPVGAKPTSHGHWKVVKRWIIPPGFTSIQPSTGEDAELGHYYSVTIAYSGPLCQDTEAVGKTQNAASPPLLESSSTVA